MNDSDTLGVEIELFQLDLAVFRFEYTPQSSAERDLTWILSPIRLKLNSTIDVGVVFRRT
jgi:hypothetical protein